MCKLLTILIFLMSSCSGFHQEVGDANADIIILVKTQVLEINENCVMLFFPDEVLRGTVHPNMLNAHGAVRLSGFFIPCNKKEVYAGQSYVLYMKIRNDKYKTSAVKNISDSFWYSMEEKNTFDLPGKGSVERGYWQEKTN